MKLGATPGDEPEVGITALIDVVFLLLIFFMVSTTFERESQLAIELPSATSAPRSGEPVALDLVIDAEGRFSLNGQLLDNPGVDRLSRALVAAADVAGATESTAQRPEPPTVTISADAATPHRAVVLAMDAARAAGLNRLAFATQFDAEASPTGAE